MNLFYSALMIISTNILFAQVYTPRALIIEHIKDKEIIIAKEKQDNFTVMLDCLGSDRQVFFQLSENQDIFDKLTELFMQENIRFMKKTKRVRDGFRFKTGYFKYPRYTTYYNETDSPYVIRGAEIFVGDKPQSNVIISELTRLGIHQCFL